MLQIWPSSSLAKTPPTPPAQRSSSMAASPGTIRSSSARCLRACDLRFTTQRSSRRLQGGWLHFFTTATASTSISHSGRTSRFTTTNVLVGGFAVFTCLSRISRTAAICAGSTLSAREEFSFPTFLKSPPAASTAARKIVEDLLHLGAEVVPSDQVAVAVLRHLAGYEHHLAIADLGNLRIPCRRLNHGFRIEDPHLRRIWSFLRLLGLSSLRLLGRQNRP